MRDGVTRSSVITPTVTIEAIHFVYSREASESVMEKTARWSGPRGLLAHARRRELCQASKRFGSKATRGVATSLLAAVHASVLDATHLTSAILRYVRGSSILGRVDELLTTDDVAQYSQLIVRVVEIENDPFFQAIMDELQPRDFLASLGVLEANGRNFHPQHLRYGRFVFE